MIFFHVILFLENAVPKEDWISTNDKNLSCSYCRINFLDLQIQREHYKLDWHRYNLKQSLLSKQPIKEEEFNEKSNNGILEIICKIIFSIILSNFVLITSF